jgi:hypothetical protein
MSEDEEGGIDAVFAWGFDGTAQMGDGLVVTLLCMGTMNRFDRATAIQGRAKANITPQL